MLLFLGSKARILSVFCWTVFLILLALPISVQCQIVQQSKINTSAKAGIEAALKTQQKHIDTALSRKSVKAVVFASISGRSQLIEVKNERWPTKITASYKMLTSSAGNIIAIIESPFSESGDWNIECIYYFDKTGKTFAFKRETTYFNDNCTDEAVRETIIEYFDPQFVRVSKEYTLTDLEGKRLKKAQCGNPYEYAYKLLPTSATLAAFFKLPYKK